MHCMWRAHGCSLKRARTRTRSLGTFTCRRTRAHARAYKHAPACARVRTPARRRARTRRRACTHGNTHTWYNHPMYAAMLQLALLLVGAIIGNSAMSPASELPPTRQTDDVCYNKCEIVFLMLVRRCKKDDYPCVYAHLRQDTKCFRACLDEEQ